MSSPEKDKPARSEKSLSTLTKKFVEMLQSEKQLDINEVNSKFVIRKLKTLISLHFRLLHSSKSTRSDEFMTLPMF
jgi:hypothetical protein